MAKTQLPALERLVKALRRLPGIGEKTATRLAYFLLAAPAGVAQELGESVLRLRQEVVVCERCFNLTESSPCEICSDPGRAGGEICVVEEPADLAAIETATGTESHLGRNTRRLCIGGANSTIAAVTV